MVCSNTGKCICGDNWIDENEDDSDGCEKFSNEYLSDQNQCQGCLNLAYKLTFFKFAMLVS
jgi:hypothetical protein